MYIQQVRCIQCIFFPFLKTLGIVDLQCCVTFRCATKRLRYTHMGFPGGSAVENPLPSSRLGFDPWVRKIPQRREWQLTPIFFPGEFQENGQGSLAGYRPWSRKRVGCDLITIYNGVQFPVLYPSVQSLSRVRLFATPQTAARQASPSITNSRSPPKPMSIESVMPSNHLILCRPLLLLPSIFPSIRVFSNESALCIRWPKYWSCSFNISPSSEHQD